MADIQMIPLPGHSSQGDTYIDSDGDVDAVGNRFSLLAEAQPGNGNITFATLRKIAPNGTVLGTWTFRPTANQKIDKANMLRSGRDVIVECITHAITSTKPRQLHKETNKVEGVWVTTSSFESERGGAGAFVPTGQQEADVDYAKIKDIMEAVAVADINPVTNTAKTAVIDNLIPKVMTALAWLLDRRARPLNDGGVPIVPNPTWLNEGMRALIGQYQDRLFETDKNAAANPLQNVLQGQDDWGQDRQEELKGIMRDVRDEE